MNTFIRQKTDRKTIKKRTDRRSAAVRQVAALLVLATICRRPVTLTFGVLCYKEI